MKMRVGEGTVLKVIVLGLRGMPNVPGGIEAHASELYPRLQALGANVTVVGRAPHRPTNSPSQWQGVKLKWLPAPKTQGVEALIHTFFGVMYAACRRPDVLHVHAIGPWLWLPLAKLLGLKVVVTHHGQDYLREKWNAPARALLRLGERFGMTMADECIVISQEIRESVLSKFGRAPMLVPNGVGNLTPMAEDGLLRQYVLTKQRYVVQVARLVPEKRQHDLITAFRAARLPGWKLVLVGGAQGSQKYADKLREMYQNDDSIVCTGFLTPPDVHQLLSHAGIFALPSSHEGLPIALLEAMKMGIPVLASDIAGNVEVGLRSECYFPLGDTDALAARIQALSAASAAQRAEIRAQLLECCGRYDWDVIAKTTLHIMERVAHKATLPVTLSGSNPAARTAGN